MFSAFDISLTEAFLRIGSAHSHAVYTSVPAAVHSLLGFGAASMVRLVSMASLSYRVVQL